jgi:hypothetical protein
MKHPLKYGIFVTLGDYEKKPVLSVDIWVSESGLEYWKNQGKTLVQLIDTEIEIPAYEELVRDKITHLEGKIKETLAEAHVSANRLRDQIQDLLALPAPRADGSEE